jgi:hypothetical protein
MVVMNGYKLALCGVLLSASSVAADDLILSPSPPIVQQRVTYYSGPAYGTSTVVTQAVPTTTYYAPAPAPVTTYYAPAPAPVTTYYAPAPTPVTTYYAPAVVAPRPVVTYYAPAPAPVTTYYAPGAVPVTTYYAPATVAVPTYGVVRSKVYYPGEPVRNFFKALAP